MSTDDAPATEKILTLYHFTCLTHLPPILQEGILIGAFPDPTWEYEWKCHYPSLTRDPDPASQRCWANGSNVDKTRVRLTVDVPVSELMSFSEVADVFGFPEDDELFEGRTTDWFHAPDGVPPDRITRVEVALDRPFHYTTFRDRELDGLVGWIDDQRTKLEFVAMEYVLIKPGVSDCLLLDGTAPDKVCGGFRSISRYLPSVPRTDSN